MVVLQMQRPPVYASKCWRWRWAWTWTALALYLPLIRWRAWSWRACGTRRRAGWSFEEVRPWKQDFVIWRWAAPLKSKWTVRSRTLSSCIRVTLTPRSMIRAVMERRCWWKTSMKTVHGTPRTSTTTPTVPSTPTWTALSSTCSSRTSRTLSNRLSSRTRTALALVAALLLVRMAYLPKCSCYLAMKLAGRPVTIAISRKMA